VAFVSLRFGHSIEAAAIKDHLRASLPEVMVPAHIVVLQALPQTPNGKIDRNALPSGIDVHGRRPASTAPAAAENELERTVLSAWHEALGNEAIGVNDNFFDVGGHSLLIVRLHRSLRATVKQNIALTDLYRFPTVRGFVSFLQSESSPAGARRGADRAARRLERRRLNA
jgi:hypothetical protein